jgi:hypothetical protein
MTASLSPVRPRSLLVGLGIVTMLVVSSVGACQFQRDLRHRRQADRVRLGASGPEVAQVFGRAPDCTFTVEGYDVRYYLSPAFSHSRARSGSRCVLQDGKVGLNALPGGLYCAAFVVLRQSKVVGVKLLGEGWLVRDEASLPKGYEGPDCC